MGRGAGGRRGEAHDGSTCSVNVRNEERASRSPLGVKWPPDARSNPSYYNSKTCSGKPAPKPANITEDRRHTFGEGTRARGAMGGGDALQKSMAVLAAVKKGMTSVSELRDRCNDAIRAGVDVNGVAERQRVPVGGVHGRDYMKLVRDDVKLRLKEHAEKEGKRLPGFGNDDGDGADAKRLAVGGVDGEPPLRLGTGDSSGERLVALGDGKERGKGRATSTSGSEDDGDDADIPGMSKGELVDAVLKERVRGAKLKRRLERMEDERKRKRKRGRKEDDKRRRKGKGKKKSKSKSRRRSSSSSSSSSSSESSSSERRYDHISGKVIKLKRKSSRVDDRLESNRLKTLKLLNSAY